MRLGRGRRRGRGYERVAAGTFGELQTRELLAEAGGGGSADAAAGWGGDRYELWQRAAPEDCAAPCRRANVLAVRWAWDTPRDEREFAAKLRQWVRDGLATTRGRGRGRRGPTATLALAPSAAEARRGSPRR